MLRDNVASGTELGREAKTYMDAGELVPDELVTAMVVERLSASDADCGYLLDGFPRTEAQADALEEATADHPVELSIYLDVPGEELVSRLLGRGRPDDTEEVVRNRLRVYREETEPLIRHYESGGMLRGVDGVGSVPEVFSRIAEVLAG